MRIRKILVLLDRYALLPGSTTFEHEGSDWAVTRCLERLGHEVTAVEFTSPGELLAVIDQIKPDIVFNLTEAAADRDRSKDANICALFELLAIPYTGATARGLMLCRDKATSKLIAERCGFRVPRFLVVEPGPLRLPRQLPLPIVVKPRFGDASEGITAASLVSTREQLIERIKYLRRKHCQHIICEEYIAGREFIVGVLHNRIVRPKEFRFDQSSRHAPRIATEAFKYDQKYRARWHIRTVFANLGDESLNQLGRIASLASVALEARDYARFDVRLTAEGEWTFLEANPNPGLSPPGKNWAGTWDGVTDYEAMIGGIVEHAIARGPR